MKKPIKDIKVLGPGDKLIILGDHLSRVDAMHAKDVITKFIEDEKDKFLIINNIDVYIMRKGSKVLLKDAMNEEIEKEGEKSDKQKV